MLSVKRLKLTLILLAIFLIAIAAPVCASSQKFVAIAAGYTHSLALTDDGTVWTWGNISSTWGNSSLLTILNGNYSGDIRQVSISDVRAIAAGVDCSYALKRDGTVWAWGDNFNGELGDGTTETSFTPVQVKGLSNVTEISAGTLYGIALKSDGTVWTWGYNHNQNNVSRLGDGTTEDQLTPVQVKDLANVTKIMGPCFAIKDDGTVWAWGNALNVTDIWEAYQVPEMTNIKAIDMDYGYVHALFIREDGTVWSWGYNDNGQFGNGTFMRGHPYFNETFQAKGLADVKSVSAGDKTSMALKNDGTVWVWGQNQDGMLGTGQMCESELVPVMIQGLIGVVAISSKNQHSVFLKEDGSVWECGSDGDGQMGDNSIVGAYIKQYPIFINGTPIGAYIDKPIKILGPNTSVPSVNTTVTPNPSASGTTQSQDNGLLNIVIVVCALLLIGGGIVYFGIIRKM
jgi:alpha-tubulin suppressor-like RCC1 family protein